MTLPRAPNIYERADQDRLRRQMEVSLLQNEQLARDLFAGVPISGLNGFIRPSSYFPEETYYPCSGVLLSFVNGTPALERYVYLPFVLEQSVSVDKIAFEVANPSAAGGVSRCAIYNANQDTLKPTTRIAEGGEQAVNSAGIKATVVSITLAAGLVYFGANVTGGGPTTAQYKCISSGAAVQPFFGFFNAAGSLFPRQGWYRDATYGEHPADVSSETFSSLQTGHAPPLTFFRVASLI